MPGKGRPFKKGQGGRPKGAKNRVPSEVKASLKAIYEELAIEDRDQWKATIRRIMRRGGRDSFAHFQLAGYYLDGRPVERVEMAKGQEVLIIDTFSAREEAKKKYPEEFQESPPPGASEPKAEDDEDEEVIVRPLDAPPTRPPAPWNRRGG